MNGGVQINDINSTKVNVTTVNGNIAVTCVYCAQMTAESTNGNVTGNFAILVGGGSYNLSATNDNINFTAPNSSSFHVTATVLNGSVYCYMTECPSTQAPGKSLKQTFGTGNASVSLDSVNGQITLTGT